MPALAPVTVEQDQILQVSGLTNGSEYRAQSTGQYGIEYTFANDIAGARAAAWFYVEERAEFTFTQTATGKLFVRGLARPSRLAIREI